jgi:formate dehydrogenase subunit delta
MNVTRLVDMANSIAAFFASDPDPGSAAAQVAAHLRKFWEPRMRREITAHLAAGGAGLSPIARAAVSMLDAPSTPAR